MKNLYSGKLVLAMLMLAMSFAFVSCNKDDDDKLDCDAIENQLEDLDDDIDDAFDSGDCGDLEDALNEYISVIKKGKSCEFVIEEAEDNGYDEDEIDDYIEDLEELVDLLVDDCNA